MRSRVLRILVLCFVSVWFGAIVPGHTRGMVQMPGSAAQVKAGGGSGCCAAHGEGSQQSDAPPAKAACAVCFFAAALMVAPPVSFDFAQLGLVGSLAPPAPDRVVCHLPYQPYQSRAPPSLA